MEHNLGDSLNLDSTMGEMGFESSDIVVNQADITLDTHDGDMTMEFEHIEEQQILMDSGNEEIIVSDFIGDQFNLQEYSIQDDQTSEMTTVEDSNLSSQSETMVDLQFESQNVIQSTPDAKGQPQYIAVRAAPSVHPSTSKKLESTVLTTIPRQVAIAPKPPRLVPITSNRFTVPQNKQIAIAPKPVAMITNKANFIKKVPLSSVQGGATGNSVLAQIGKQLVVMPPGVSQKIKLVATNNPGVSVVQYIKAANDQAQLIPNKNASAQQTNKPMLAKVIQVQGQHNIDLANQPAVITKIAPTSTANVQQTRYIMQTKTVPISIGNKVVMASPTKQGVKFTKKQQIISIKSPTPKLMPAPVTSTGPTTKKVVISANPSQNVILKTTAPSKTAQVLEVTKDGKVVVQGQRSQLHQINVPGKGIQYIRLITNQTPATSKSVTKTQAISVSTTPKTFVLSDNKGPQKLMRIAAAPVSVKSAPVSQATVRSSQSLLAPLSPVDMEQDSDYSIKQEQSSTERVEVAVSTEETLNEVQDESFDGAQDSGSEDADIDSKVTLQDLLTRAPSRDLLRDLKNSQSQTGNKNTKSMEETSEQRSQEHPLIVISTDYGRISQDGVEGDSRQEQSNTMVNEDVDVLNAYHSPKSPPGESDVMSGDLAFKPRRACNCTKSQCLKLYCDCFANGEFCNRCNCNNCHNNLDHEDLRQMAIRACLDRNPNAFRPKIGKTKAGGPEIIRRHNKGCNCKRSGCLKNYCECYEAKIACTSMCRCVGCRNIEDALGRRRPAALYRPQHQNNKQPCTFMTTEVIEAVCQCLLAAAADGHARADPDPVRNVVDEFGRCLQDIIGASHHQLLDQRRA